MTNGLAYSFITTARPLVMPSSYFVALGALAERMITVAHPIFISVPQAGFSPCRERPAMPTDPPDATAPTWEEPMPPPTADPRRGRPDGPDAQAPDTLVRFLTPLTGTAERRTTGKTRLMRE
jgi:hypothetical protein